MAKRSEIEKAVMRHAQADLASIPTASHETTAPATPKFGEGHFQAMLRLGAHELTQILPAFPQSNVRALEEPGVVGNTTPQIVTDQMGYHPQDVIRTETPRYDPESHVRGGSGQERERGRSR